MISEKEKDWIKMQAWLFYQYGFYKKSKTLVEFLYLLDRKDRSILKLKAIILIKLKESEKTIILLNSLLKTSQDTKEKSALWFYMSKAFLQLKDLDNAKKAYSKFLELMPVDSVKDHHNLIENEK